MAGHGPAPKDPSRRARGSRGETVQARTIRFEPAEQPELPDSVDWHPQTRQWWARWKDAPQSEHFMTTDWDFLLDTAVLHDAFWRKGQWTLAAEVRLRVAKYGATPEDRARLRMHFADADEKDAKRPEVPSSRQAYGGLKAV